MDADTTTKKSAEKNDVFSTVDEKPRDRQNRKEKRNSAKFKRTDTADLIYDDSLVETPRSSTQRATVPESSRTLDFNSADEISSEQKKPQEINVPTQKKKRN